MGTEEPSSSSSSSSSSASFLGATVVPSPLSAAHFEPTTTSLRRASLSATAQLTLRSPAAPEPQSAPVTPVTDQQRPRDQRQEQPTVGQGPNYFTLVLNTANSVVANAFHLKPALDSHKDSPNSNANTGTSTGPNTAKYDMKKIADKRPPTVTVSLDDVTGKTGVGEGEIDQDGNITSSPKSADILKLQLPESQQASGSGAGVANIDTDAQTHSNTTAPMDVSPTHKASGSKNRPLVTKSQSAMELQSYNDLATPISKLSSSISSLGDIRDSQQLSSIRTFPQSAVGGTKFQTLPYNKRDGAGTPGSYSSSGSPARHTMPRFPASHPVVDTSVQAAANGEKRNRATAFNGALQGSADREGSYAPVTASDSSANEYTVASGLSSEVSASPRLSATFQSSSSSNSSTSTGTNGEEAALSLSSSLCGSAKKKNAEFHTRFKSVPAEEMLIDEFICALSRDILVQGRLYVAEHHVCFYANVFGWVTQLVIAFQEIVNIEKKVVLLIPNAIQIETMHSKHFFASFFSRDVAYAKLMECWRSSQSILLSSTIAYEPLPLEVATSPSTDSIEEGSYSSKEALEDATEIDSGEERDGEEMASDTEESDCSAQDGQESSRTNTSPTEKTLQNGPYDSPPPSTATEAGTDRDIRNTPVSTLGSESSSDNNDDGSFPPTSSNHTTDSGSFRKRRSRHRGLLSRKNASNSALSMLAASTLGSVVFDTAAAAAAASGKRRRAQTDVNSRRREEAAEARRKVTKEKKKESTPPSTTGESQQTPATMPEKQTSKSDPNLLPSTAPPPPPATAAKHARTTCLCSASAHGPEHPVLLDKIYPAPPTEIMNLVFDGGLRGESDGRFSNALMEKEGGIENIEIEKWRDVSANGDEVKAMRNISYVKRLAYPIGPKSTTCKIIEEMLADDPERCITVRSTVSTPNVPSGGSFAVKIITCLTWAENEQCRMHVNFWIEWTAKSWLKGTIERSVADGNKSHYELLDTELRNFIAKHSLDVQPSAGPTARTENEPRLSKKKSGREGGKIAAGTLASKEGRGASTKRKSRRRSSAAPTLSSPPFLSDPMGYLNSPANSTRILLAIVFAAMFLLQTFVLVRLTHLGERIREGEEKAVADRSGTTVAPKVIPWRPLIRPFSTGDRREGDPNDFARESAVPTREDMDAFWDWLADVEGGRARRSEAEDATTTSTAGTSNVSHAERSGRTTTSSFPKKSHLHDMSKLALATERQLRRILNYVEKEMKAGDGGHGHDHDHGGGGPDDQEGRKPERREDVPGRRAPEG